MKIIGHHTCSQEENIEVIAKNGPFLSTHVEDDPQQHKFLGTGYYFWDNNVGMAHAHGQNNYKRKYYIFEADLDINDNIFYDLAGNRTDMLHFQEIMEKLQEIEETKDWGIAHYIEFLKRKNMFPYRVIRAMDTSINPKKVVEFVPKTGRKNFINLNPIFIVCLLDNKSDLISSFKHIRTFPNE